MSDVAVIVVVAVTTVMVPRAIMGIIMSVRVVMVAIVIMVIIRCPGMPIAWIITPAP